MNKNNTRFALITIVLFIITLVSSCNTVDKLEITHSPTELPTTSTLATIKNNTFTSELLGIEMELPGEWYIVYKTTPDDVVHFSLISGFDSTIPQNGSLPILTFENVFISFMIEKEDEGNPDLNFFAMKDEHEGISLEQVIENIKDGFDDKDDLIIEDLPDMRLDNITFKRFKILGSGYRPTMHVALKNGYTVLITCNHKYEVDYNEMEDIISTFKIINE